MKNPFDLTGEVYFPGGTDALLEAISRVNGTMMEGQQFRCLMTRLESGPAVYFRMKGFGISFRCRYTQKGNGYLIFYRAPLPFPVWLIWAFAAYNLVSAIFTDPGLWENVLPILLLAAIFTAAVVFVRRIFAGQFEAIFAGETPVWQ